MHDPELRKIALHKAHETCGGQSTDYLYLLEAAEAIYQWLRHGPAEVPKVNPVPTQADLFDSDLASPGEPIWRWDPSKSFGTSAKVRVDDSYDWPVTVTS